MNSLLTKFGSVIGGGFLFLASLFGVHQTQAPAQQLLGATGVIPQTAAFFDTQLGSAMSSVSTSFTLQSNVTGIGTTLLNGYYSFIIDQGNPQQEVVECTITGLSATGCLRGIDAQNPDITSSSLAMTHNVGADIKITIYSWEAHVSNILTGSDTFPNILQYATSVTNVALASNLYNFANVSYVNSVASSGAPAATTVTPGLVRIAGSAQIYYGLGASGALFVPSSDFYSHVASTSPIIVVASGSIDSSLISSTSIATAIVPYVPVGTIEAYVSSTAPTGWLLANGQTVATTTYPNLFSLIGYTYGGSTSTFGVPNLGGRFIAGPSSTLSTTIGATGGSTVATGSVSVSTNLSYGICSGGANCGSSGGNYYAWANTASNTVPTGNATSTAIPPYFIAQYIIKF